MPSHQVRVQQNNCDHYFEYVTIMKGTGEIKFDGQICKFCGKKKSRK